MDIQRGDRIQLDNGEKGLVVLVINNIVYYSLDTTKHPLNIQTGNESIKFRYPRPGEMIEVSIDNITWIKRIAVYMNKELPDDVGCIDKEQEIMFYEFWKLIPKEKTKEERIKETIEKIKNDDPETIKELAEIILERLNLDERRY